MFKVISTTRFEKVIISIDDEDSERYDQHKWYVTETNQIISVINGKSTTLPRFLLTYEGEMDIDHIDNKFLNNHKYNLRYATHGNNLCNRMKFSSYSMSPTTSKYKGVTYDWVTMRWKAQIGYNNNVYYLGLFETEIEASIAYNKAACELHKEFKHLNVVPKNFENAVNPMTLENMIRLLQTANEQHTIKCINEFVKHNPIMTNISTPELDDLESFRQAQFLIYHLSLLMMQTPPEWCCDIDTVNNVDRLN